VSVNQNNYNFFLNNLQLLSQNLPSFNVKKFLNSLNSDRKNYFKINLEKLEESNYITYDILSSFGEKVEKKMISGELIYFSNSKLDFSNNFFFLNGYIYSQESSSFVYQKLVKSLIIENFEKDEGNIILDLCASPGGKSLGISSELKRNKFINSVLISNEIDGVRNKVLQENIEKWEVDNVIVTQNFAEKFGENLVEVFDLVCVDAPCSGEGMLRKLNQNEFFKNYNETLIKKCKNRQVEILQNISPSIKIGGFLIYSTCTYNLAENEEVVQYAIDNLGFQEYRIKDFEDFVNLGIVESRFSSLRFFPQNFDGEGLFITILQKTESYKLNNIINPSLWKNKRIKQDKIVIETRDIFKQSLIEFGADLVRFVPVKYDLKEFYVNYIYLVSFSLIESIFLLNQFNFKITRVGKKVLKFGKNIQKTITKLI
jgi:16S rRNA C967 or C1407 C5-methylase (RsmB/RsmF family)